MNFTIGKRVDQPNYGYRNDNDIDILPKEYNTQLNNQNREKLGLPKVLLCDNKKP